MRIQLPVGLLQLNNANNNLFTSSTIITNGNNQFNNFPALTTSSTIQSQNIRDFNNEQQQQQQQITDTYFYEDNPNITITSDNTVTFHKNIFNNHQLNNTTEHCTENQNALLVDTSNLNVKNFNCELLANKKNVINDNEGNYCDSVNENICETVNYTTVAEKDDNKQILENCNTTDNIQYNLNNHNINLVCRENLAKLDFNTNSTNHMNSGGGSSSRCSESSPDDSFMDEEDIYTESPSSYKSLNSPELNYPRGIINPNYPGFQHLAHTLAEHFVDHHHFEQSSDSDISEFELEISRKNSQDNNPLNINNLNNNNNNQNNNINLNNNNNNSVNDEKLTKIEDIIKCAFESKNDFNSEAIIHQNAIKNEQSSFYQIDDIKPNPYNNTMMSVDNNKLSKRFETFVDADEPEEKKKIKQIYQTPDILLKNKTFEKHFERLNDCELEKPDILRNVYANDADEDSTDNSEIAYEKLDDEKVDSLKIDEDNDGNEKDERKIDNHWSVTPVDIVGNFKQEIEREFGLIVSGYRNTNVDDDVMLDAEQMENLDKDDINAIGGSAMAVEDDGANKTYTQINAAAIAHSPNETLATTDLDSLSCKCDHQEQCDPIAKYINSFDNKSNNEKSLFNNTTTATNDNQNCIQKPLLNTTIPTAIVKPKYQRLPHDDRQLPPVVCIDREKSWFDNNTFTANTTNNNNNVVHGKRIQLPHFERKSKKKFQTTAITCDSKELINGSTVVEKDTFVGLHLREKQKIDSSAVVAIVTPRKKEKLDDNMENCTAALIDGINDNSNSKISSNINNNNNNLLETRPKVLQNTKHVKSSKEVMASFDVYNIETALPVIDLEAIESHLKAAKEEERRKRNDREEIRRRLAMGADDDYYNGKIVSDKPGRKPSLHSRLQSGMNLQICFMNETASSTDSCSSSSSGSDTCPKLSKSLTFTNNSSSYGANSHPYNSRPLSVNIKKSCSMEKARPNNLPIDIQAYDEDTKEFDFFTKQARLQIEARMALAQAKDMAHMQMEMDRQKLKQSPITEIIRNSLYKVGLSLSPEKRRVSRQMLTDMNIAQLQIIVNELHTQIERLNENLVQFLMDRDDLHMSQDSMLVDIEDLTRYLSAKEQTNDGKQHTTTSSTTTLSQSAIAKPAISSTGRTAHHQNKFLKIANLVKK